MYAIHKGHKVGVFIAPWNEVRKYVDGFGGAVFKKFSLDQKEEAEQFVKTGTTPHLNPLGSSKINKKQSTHSRLSAPSHQSLYIFTDGSWLPKTGRSGIGVVFSSPLDDYSFGQELPNHTTHQQCELQAILSAMEKLSLDISLILPKAVNSIEIWTDSKYSYKCVTKYIKSWLKNGWKTALGDPVQHQNIIMAIYAYLQKDHRISIHHISEVGLVAHSNNYTQENYRIWRGNHDADILASGKSLKKKGLIL